MSDDAKTLLHYAGNSRSNVADDSDRDYCSTIAHQWAERIIGYGC